MNYIVSDYIIRLKNASFARRKMVNMPFAKIVLAIGKALVKTGFLSEVKEEIVEGKKHVISTIRYENRKPVLTGVEVVSKPSLRVHIPTKKIIKNQGKTITAILSTNQGILSGKEAAKKGVGGELLFKIW